MCASLYLTFQELSIIIELHSGFPNEAHHQTIQFAMGTGAKQKNRAETEYS